MVACAIVRDCDACALPDVRRIVRFDRCPLSHPGAPTLVGVTAFFGTSSFRRGTSSRRSPVSELPLWSATVRPRHCAGTSAGPQNHIKSSSGFGGPPTSFGVTAWKRTWWRADFHWCHGSETAGSLHTTGRHGSETKGTETGTVFTGRLTGSHVIGEDGEGSTRRDEHHVSRYEGCSHNIRAGGVCAPLSTPSQYLPSPSTSTT